MVVTVTGGGSPVCDLHHQEYETQRRRLTQLEECLGLDNYASATRKKCKIVISEIVRL